MKKSLRHVLFMTGLLISITSFATPDRIESQFLALSDIHLDQSSTHPMEISPSSPSGENDLDPYTFNTLISVIGSVPAPEISHAKFVVVLGDIVGHIRSSSESVLNSETAVFRKLKQNFPNTPIFYVFGNNDSFAVNYGPFEDANQTGNYKSPYDVATLNAGWADGFLSTGTICKKGKSYPCLITEDKKHGYYSAYVEQGLRFIAINSVMFSPKRSQVTAQDATDELNWLDAQLKEATENHEGAIIAMHIPPGNNVYDHSAFWLEDEEVSFNKILASYPHTIIGVIGGHTHSEELKVVQNSSNKIIGGVYFVAGLSTSHGNQPSFKLFSYQKMQREWLLSNYETYHFYLMGNDLVLSSLYQYSDYYCDADRNNSLVSCLGNVTADKMQKYMSAGNPNYAGAMNSPEDIYLKV